ncbi:MAG: DUF3467 domain-containing protein [Thermoanaerobaculia bacterium]
MKDKKPIQIQIVVEDSIAQGEYSNFLSVLHNPMEFILDFGRIVPGKPEVKVKSRIITTPYHIKRFLETLKQNIENYEKNFGQIKTDFGEEGPPPENLIS